jgi:hypothetical protein
MARHPRKALAGGGSERRWLAFYVCGFGLFVMMCAARLAWAANITQPDDPFADFQIIMWQPHTAKQDEILKQLGITAGMVHANRASPNQIEAVEADPLLQTGLRFYVENVATDFYSAYHRWFPDRPVNWRFTEVQRRYRMNPQDPLALDRDPSLSDPRWLDRIRGRVQETVSAYDRYRPLYYDLADEPGIADLAAYWDFDFSVPSLAGMRTWLRTQYGSLASLNREWGSQFKSWQSVMPSTTVEAMRRTDANFSSWADFKAWMDTAFARALAQGRDAVHIDDPHALAALEGGQVPGWGGYDYTRLVHAVDVMELYDSGENVDIVRSLSPATTILTTSFAGGPAEEWRVWREALRGTRGLILWDENDGFVQPDGSLGERGREAAPYFRELRGGLGALLINSAAETDPIAILYSPASMRTQWMLDWRLRGDAWTRRGSETEAGSDNTVRSALSAYIQALRRHGLTPRFVSPELLAGGVLERGAYRVLILPHAIALSAIEVSAVRRFVAEGGMILADTEPGLFDKHSRKLRTPRLAALFGAESAGNGRRVRILDPGAAASVIIAGDGVRPAIRVEASGGEPKPEVEIHRFRDGNVEILGIERSEPPTTSATSVPVPISVRLPKAAYVYDLRTGRSFGKRAEVQVALDAASPILLAVSSATLPSPVLSGPSNLHIGESGRFRLSLSGQTEARFEVFHVDVLDPAGAVEADDSRNLVVLHGTALTHFAIAENALQGQWTIRITDLPSGRTATAHFVVSAR